MFKIMKGDCLELLKGVDTGSVDMILCDLPYGTTRNKWDSVIDLDVLWGEYKRVIKDDGAIVLFAQSPFDKVLAMSCLSLYRYEWIWKKDSGTGFLNANRMPLKNHENILVFYKKLPVYNPQFGEGNPYFSKQGRPSSNYRYASGGFVTENAGKRYPTTVLNFSRDKSKRYHPTQKPIELLEYLIKTYTRRGDVVLDNCMGSGSTGVACYNCGRSFIGMEKDESYFKIAEERLGLTFLDKG